MKVFLPLLFALLAAGCNQGSRAKTPTTPKEKLIECCIQGCIQNSGGRDYCQGACENELAQHPNELRSIYCNEPIEAPKN